MITVAHRIAGIAFRTESTRSIPGLDNPSYERFRVEEGAIPDVRLRIWRIEADPLTLPPLPAADRERLGRAVHPTAGGLDSPLLRAPPVWERVAEALAAPAQTYLSLGADRVLVYDFAACALDMFYSEAYGHTHEDLPAEEQLDAGEGPGAGQFRLHPLPAAARTLPPPTAAEQARLAQGIDLMGLRLFELAVWQSALLRAALQESIDRADRLQAYHWGDGLMVWNQTQGVVDYFYPAEGGRVVSNAEMRVASNLRQLFAAFLPHFSALQLHSAGLIRNGRAALFLAPDGGGKTTALSRLAGGLLLNDDQVIVRQEGDEMIAHGTPFGTLTDGPIQARLGGLFVLEKALVFELLPYSPADLVKACWDEHLNHLFFLPRPLRLRAFDLLYEVCHRVPVYRMRFPRNHVDWTAIDAALAASR